MRVRPIEFGDYVRLDELAMASGFEYIAPPASTFVVVDDSGSIVMACGPRQIVELYLWADDTRDPAVKLAALRLLHETMAPDLKARGTKEVNAFLPPGIANKFGRRLAKMFGWKPNWPSWCKTL